MANQRKVYTIEIQLDSARQQLEDANKKLKELDEQLQGLDRNSDQAKALIAEMAKLAKEVDGLTGEVGDFSSALDDLKPGTIPALEAEIEELEEALRRTVIGTKEQEAALIKLGNAKGKLKELEDAVDALDPKMKAAAFADFANGVVGAFAISTAAAETFGLSSSVAEEYQKKLLTLITVMDGVEQVSRALNSETLSVVKSSLASAKAFLGMGEAASTGAKVTRAALISTGIGAIVVLVGLLIANWDSLTESVRGSFTWFEKVKAVTSGLFNGLIEGAKSSGKILLNLFKGDAAGVLLEARNFGSKVGAAYMKGYQDSLFEDYKRVIQTQLDENERFLKIRQAQGKETYELEKKILLDKILLAKQGTEEEKKARRDLIGELAALNAAHKKQEAEDQNALNVARLQAALTGLETQKAEYSKAYQNYSAQISQLELQGQLSAEAAEELRGARLAKIMDEQAQRVFAQRLKIQRQELEILKTAPQVNGAAVLAKEAEIAQTLEQKRQALGANEFEAFKARNANLEKLERISETEKAERLAKLREELGAKINDGTAKKLDQLSKEAAERARIAANSVTPVGEFLLIKLFGVSADKVEAVKQVINQAVSDIANSLNSIADTLLSDALGEVEEELAVAQTAYDEASSKLDATRSKRESDEEALKTATGARRDFLIARIQKERAEEERLAAAKAKAAKQEQEAQKEKARLEKEQQKVTAANTLAASAYNAVLAVQAALKAVAKGSEVPFPANVFAIAAGLAAVATAVVSARSLGKSLGDGGLLEDGGEIKGGSHASGNDVPVMGGRYRVEGGEMITPVDATQKNRSALELIRTEGRRRTLLPSDFAQAGNYRVLPAPITRTQGSALADGGILGSAPVGSASPEGSGITLAEVAAQIQQTNALLARVVSSNDAIASYGPAQLAIGPGEAVAIDGQKKLAEQASAPVRL
ncbi:hypothetical protein [Hymenobacter sp. YC55]|uniref:hypothetical protein n=1 Tax=Hymenobacter sp. YC55 TaxID=3034019 RepID=UPI0023F910B8|nr:hypothetical protein [Hymenobacter sp. YC55]MDF7810758.1 hypothetical protein [Hymenobacter sp. YC55]